MIPRHLQIDFTFSCRCKITCNFRLITGKFQVGCPFIIGFKKKILLRRRTAQGKIPPRNIDIQLPATGIHVSSNERIIAADIQLDIGILTDSDGMP